MKTVVLEKVPVDDRYDGDLADVGPCWMDRYGNIVRVEAESHVDAAWAYGEPSGCLMRHGWAKRPTASTNGRFISDAMLLTQRQFDKIAEIYEAFGLDVQDEMRRYDIR
jgi:hypothetical protein